MALATPDQWKDFKNLDTASNLAKMCLSAADEWVKGCLGRAVEVGTFTERHNGGSSLIWPRNWPVVSVSKLVVDGQEWFVLLPDAKEDHNEEVFLPSSRIWLEARSYLSFPDGVGNVLLAYEGGYKDIPSRLTLATIEVATLCFLEQQRIGDQQRSGLGAVQVTEYVRNAKQYGFIVDTLAAYSLFGQVKLP